MGSLSPRFLVIRDIPALPACLVVAQAMAGADRASFPGLGDPA